MNTTKAQRALRDYCLELKARLSSWVAFQPEARPKKRVRPSVEALEDRVVPSVGNGVNSGPESTSAAINGIDVTASGRATAQEINAPALNNAVLAFPSYASGLALANLSPSILQPLLNPLPPPMLPQRPRETLVNIFARDLNIPTLQFFGQVEEQPLDMQDADGNIWEVKPQPPKPPYDEPDLQDLERFVPIDQQTSQDEDAAQLKEALRRFLAADDPAGNVPAARVHTPMAGSGDAADAG